MKSKRSGRGGAREPSPGKTLGRQPNQTKGLPERKRKQFSLYPADIVALEAMSAAEGSYLIRGLIRYAEGLPEAEIRRLIEKGRPPR